MQGLFKSDTLPGKAQEQINAIKILASQGYTKTGSDVSVINENDLIYYDKNAGHSMLINDVPYTIILERDVVVVL